jgi:hypothetical protein
MLGNMILIATMIGQTAVDSQRTGPVLSEQAQRAQARALAEFRAHEHTIKPRLAAYYQLQNERLMNRIETVNIATSRVWSVTAGTMGQATYQYQDPWASRSFSSVPPTGQLTTLSPPDESSLEELRRANFLLEGHLRDSRDLNRQAVQFYNAVRAPRYQRAICTPSRSSYLRSPEVGYSIQYELGYPIQYLLTRRYSPDERRAAERKEREKDGP